MPHLPLSTSFLKPCLLFLLALLLIVSGCARTVARSGLEPSIRLVFQFSVQGRLALNRQDVTYYIVINAPDGQKDQTIDPATQGPRVNGPSLNFTPDVLQGRLPFMGLIQGDVTSVWTDFYFITSDGTRPVIGRGRRIENGTPEGVPEIILRNYPEALWRKINDQTLEVQIVLNDLFDIKAMPRNIVVNLASSDSIDTGQGFVYDYWRSNIPFAVRTEINPTIFRETDTNSQLIMRPIPNKQLPQLPQGVAEGDVNITSYEYRVQQICIGPCPTPSPGSVTAPNLTVPSPTTSPATSASPSTSISPSPSVTTSPAASPTASPTATPTPAVTASPA